MNTTITKFVIDDAEDARLLVKNIFEANGITNYMIFDDFNEMREALKKEPLPDVLVIDYYVGKETAYDVIHEVKVICPDCHLIIMSGHTTVEILVELINTHMRLTFIDKGKPSFGEKLLFFVNEVCEEILADRREHEKKLEQEKIIWEAKKEELCKCKFHTIDESK